MGPSGTTTSFLKGMEESWHLYFVTRDLRSAWLRMGGWGDADLATLRAKHYVPFSWKDIPRFDETDLPFPAPVVKGVPSEIDDIVEGVVSRPGGREEG